MSKLNKLKKSELKALVLFYEGAIKKLQEKFRNVPFFPEMCEAINDAIKSEDDYNMLEQLSPNDIDDRFIDEFTRFTEWKYQGADFVLDAETGIIETNGNPYQHEIVGTGKTGWHCISANYKNE